MVAEILGRPKLKQSWVPLGRMSPDLPLAVIIREDGRFCDHWGVDWLAVRDAIKEGRRLGRDFRGASTITMQLAKNLYLWPERSYVRKMLEVPLAYILSALWPKRVLMETYLNIVPFGPGIVGADAASRHFFDKKAADLTPREAILLATVLRRPSLDNPAKPTPKMLKVVDVIDKRMQMFASRAKCIGTGFLSPPFRTRTLRGVPNWP